MSSFDTQTPATDRLRIGDCVVVLSSREVHAPNTHKVHRITPKSVGVLLVLARRAGQVVTRDELFAEVWPDTLPTNDVLTQAVTQLRKVFAGGDEATPYIETIAKTGYRLLVPVAWEQQPQVTELQGLEEPASAMAPVPTASVSTRSTQRRLRRYVLWAIGVGLLLSTVLMAWLLWHNAAATDAIDGVVANTASGSRVLGSPQRPYRLITSTAAYETQPNLSPDGSLVVFAREDATRSSLWIQSTGNATASRLLPAPEGVSDRFPVWSPNGRQIAFARFHPDGACEVLLVSATGGNPRRATRCDGTDMLSFDWSNDGRRLLFGSMTGRYASAGIRLLELDSGRWSSIAYAKGVDDFDYAPRYSPDGRQIGFVRNPQVGDMWVMDADGRKARRLTNDAAEIRGWTWLVAGEMVFGRRVDSESRLYHLDVGSGVLRDMGLGDAQSPAASRHGGNLAFTRDQPQVALFKVPLGSADVAPQRLFASSARDGQPMIAPDGKQLAFTSDRSGAFAVWWGRVGQPDTLQMIEGLRPEARQPMTWSADSRSLLVSGRDSEGVPGIYEVVPEEGHWKRLPVPVNEPLQAIYGPQADRLWVIERDDAQRMQLSLFDRTQTPWKRVATLEGASQVRFDVTGNRLLFTRLASGGLWQVAPDLAAASIKPVQAEVPSRWRYRSWAVAANGAVEYLHIGNTCTSQLSSIDGDGASQCLDDQRFSSGNGFSLSPSGDAAYVAFVVADGGDIGVMRIPARPPRRLIGVAKWLPWLGKMLS